jgi:hypothetical protein
MVLPDPHLGMAEKDYLFFYKILTRASINMRLTPYTVQLSSHKFPILRRGSKEIS